MTTMSPSYERPTGLPCVECPNDETCTVVCDVMWAWAYHMITGKRYEPDEDERKPSVQVCRSCGKEFQTLEPRVKYCSDECRRDAARKQNREYSRKRRAKNELP